MLLVGMMGVGKSTVGRALSRRTGWRYLDNDELVSRRPARETADLFEDQGDTAMREAESAALSEALTEQPPVIAGVAAGAVDDPADRERLSAAVFVVWLRAPIETLVKRVGSGQGRAWLQPDPEAACAGSTPAGRSATARSRTSWWTWTVPAPRTSRCTSSGR